MFLAEPAPFSRESSIYWSVVNSLPLTATIFHGERQGYPWEVIELLNRFTELQISGFVALARIESGCNREIFAASGAILAAFAPTDRFPLFHNFLVTNDPVIRSIAIAHRASYPR